MSQRYNTASKNPDTLPLLVTDHVLVPMAAYEALVTFRERAEAKLDQLLTMNDNPTTAAHVCVLSWLCYRDCT